MANASDSYHRQSGAKTSHISSKMILNATLQTRYKYAEYLIWRPYIYRALEAPAEITRHDIECYKAYKVGFSRECKGKQDVWLFLTVSGLSNVATNYDHLSKPTTSSTTSLRVHTYVGLKFHSRPLHSAPIAYEGLSGMKGKSC